MSPRATFLLLAVAAPALGAQFTVSAPAGFELETQTLRSPEGAPLRVLANRIESSFGILLEGSGQQLASSAPLIIGRPFRVRDQRGAEYRLWVHAIAGEKRWLELLPVNPEPETSRPERIDGRFRTTRYSVGGVPSQLAPKELLLHPDGSYSFGETRGSWSRDSRAVALDGAYSDWGKGRLEEEGSAMVFRYRRGGVELEVVLTRIGAKQDALASLETGMVPAR